jgi:enoyl-CoA hydratase
MIRAEQRERVTLLRIDRHEQRNALNPEHISGLLDGLVGALAADSRCVVITGEGSSFCSGADLDVVRDGGFLAGLSTLLRMIAQTPIPVIAAVNGPAIGAGAPLAFACDLRVAGPTVRFAIPTARLGLGLDAWSIRRLVSLAGAAAARAILIGVDTMTVERAHTLGLVDRLGDLDDALAWAQEISTLAPLSLAYYKLAVTAATEPELSEDGPAGLLGWPETGERPVTAEDLDRALAACWESTDADEAMQARLERRPPQFHGR